MDTVALALFEASQDNFGKEVQNKISQVRTYRYFRKKIDFEGISRQVNDILVISNAPDYFLRTLLN